MNSGIQHVLYNYNAGLCLMERISEYIYTLSIITLIIRHTSSPRTDFVHYYNYMNECRREEVVYTLLTFKCDFSKFIRRLTYKMLHQMAPGQVNLSLKENHSLHAPSSLAGWQAKLDAVTYMYIILALQLKAGVS